MRVMPAKACHTSKKVDSEMKLNQYMCIKWGGTRTKCFFVCIAVISCARNYVTALVNIVLYKVLLSSVLKTHILDDRDVLMC